MGRDSEDLRSVLIVDSEPGGLSELKKAFDDDDYEVLGARTGNDAKRTLTRKQQGIQTVLLDWFLPDMTGLELLKWIKKQRRLKDVEVILESETLVSKDVRAGIRNGAYYSLTKP